MEETSYTEYPQYVRTISRSKNKLTIVQLWYVYFLLLFVSYLLIFVIPLWLIERVSVLSDKKLLLLTVIFCFIFSLIHILSRKGSLVETVKVDYIHQEIRIKRYNLLFQEKKDNIPFKGLSWNILNGGLNPDRLRIFSNNKKRIVILIYSLGWTIDDCNHLESALTKIVKKEY